MQRTVHPDHRPATDLNPPRRSRHTHRRLALLAGSLLALLALTLVAAGGYLFSAATDYGGWLALGHGPYATEGYAVVTEPHDWRTQTYLLDSVDQVRIRVSPDDPSTPLFVGLASPDAVARYLADVGYVTVHGAANYQVTTTPHPGQAPTVPPAQALPWTAQASGRGPQMLTFAAQATAGPQVLVVMHADGSPGLRGQAESAVTQPSLRWIAGGLLGGAGLLALGALRLLWPRRSS